MRERRRVRPRAAAARPLRLGLLGAGTALHGMYGPALRHLPQAELVGVMDPWAEARDRARADYGVRAYKTLRGLLEHARPEVAVVASPTYAHLEQVVALAAAGVHVFCEKPMARTPGECDRMIDACARAGVLLGVGFMKRFNAAVIRAGELLRQGEVGELYQVDCEWSFPASHPPERYGHPHRDWRGRLENWGGVFQDHGSHTVDLCRLWLGEVTRVSARVRAL